MLTAPVLKYQIKPTTHRYAVQSEFQNVIKNTEEK